MIKSILVFVLGAVIALACTNCHRVKKSPVLDVESTIKTDLESVYAQYGEEHCKWYETTVTLKNFLDGDEKMEIVSVESVFQATIPADSTSYNTYVIMTYHDASGSESSKVSHDFWIEDFPLVGPFLSFQTAYDKLMMANCPKPHSRKCVLRKEVGPNNVNPQYIFGNSEFRVYVDAITGDVNTENPVYPKEAQPL